MSVDSYTTVREVKEMHVDQQGGVLKVADIWLIYEGQRLETDSRMYEDGIGHGSTVCMVVRRPR